MDFSDIYTLYQKHQVLTTDSRNCPKGSIFLALKGSSFDGNKFASSALRDGCSYAIVDEAEYVVPGDERYILVSDCLQTYKDLAREHRRRFSIPVIGITGTNGKTTTKELIAAVLQERYKVLYTQGNFNNDVGVPKTLLRLGEMHEIAVIEMGASHPGDIKTLVETAEPTCGLITNVGRAHLQGFGSFEGVINTKGELYDYLRTRPDSFAFIDADNPYLEKISHGLNLLKYGCRENDSLFVRGELVECAPFLCFKWQRTDVPNSATYEVKTSMIGAYNISNMLAAISVGLKFGVDANLINRALENYCPSNNRSQLTVTSRNHLIVDAYNANPTSMAAALDNFEKIRAAKKMVILGEMRELGTASREEHQRIVEMLSRMNLDEVWLVGEEFMNIQSTFRKFRDVGEVKAALQATACPEGFYILIKGSNGTHLYELPSLL